MRDEPGGVAAVQDLAACGQARLEFRRVEDGDLDEDEVLRMTLGVRAYGRGS
ncbi:hypothetical protein [Streptomyces phaeochromogenes]|uniref:hypothetical protein n=1 Tax=Streptomyces phaeochromogenes TaxID=1923 RepID=UPI0033D60C65